jgi:hypothetical protein
MTIIRKRHIKGINLDPTDLSTESLSNPGDLAYDSSDSKLKYKDGSATREVVNTDESQTLFNKTLDITSTVEYDDTIEDVISLLKDDGVTPVENVQEALDSVKRALDNQNAAAEISYDPSGNPETDALFLQKALDDVGNASQDAQDAADAAQTAINNHILLEVSGAHAASNISVTTAGNLEAEDVQAALEELQLDIDDRALADNGTITNASIETPSRLDVKQDTEDNLETYAAGFTTPEGNGQIVFATDTKKMFQIIDGALQPIGGGGSTQFEVTQANHGFVVGNGIFHNNVSGVWEKAIADSADTLASYVVVEVISENPVVTILPTSGLYSYVINPNIGDFYIPKINNQYELPGFSIENTSNVTKLKFEGDFNQDGTLDYEEVNVVSFSENQDFYIYSTDYSGSDITDAYYQYGGALLTLVYDVTNTGFVAADFGRLEVNLLTNPDSLSTGSFYYLSDSVAGEPTTTESSLYSNPLFYVESIDATDPSNQLATLQVKVYRPEKIENGGTETPIINVNIDNNVTTPTNITDLLFDGASQRAVVIKYSVYRKSDITTEEKSQVGQLRLTYKTQNSSWSISDDFSGDNAGVDFSITSTGQVQYVSSNFTGDNYSGSLQVNIDQVFYNM